MRRHYRTGRGRPVGAENRVVAGLHIGTARRLDLRLITPADQPSVSGVANVQIPPGNKIKS